MNVTICIYNVLGQKVRVLINEVMDKGCQNVSWDGRDDQGNLAASGIYIYEMKTNDNIQSKKMILIR